MLKLSLTFTLLGLTTAAHAGNKVVKPTPGAVQCSTIGDAMDDKTYRYKTRATAGEAIAFSRGYALTTVVLVGQPNDFGGATMNAGLLVLGGRPKPGTQRSGFFSRGNTVYYLQCQN
jgi:hypothetical protein